MIPVTYPSSLSYRTTRQMVAFPITDLTGKRRWTDYIPVKFVDQTTFTIENTHDNNAYIAVDMLSSVANLREGIDYIPVYIDDAATDAWQVSATGYIPVGYSGASLSLQFAGATTLDSRITFTRASSARYFNNQGILTSAGNNVARFDHDPVTKAPRGLLIEEQRTNLFLNSEILDSWGTATRASVVSNQTAAPDGALTADVLVEDTTASNSHEITNIAGVSFVSGTAYTYSVFAKARERNQITLFLPSAAFTTIQEVLFDLSNGTTQVFTGTPTVSMTNVGNGWYRCSITATATATTSGFPRIRLASGSVTSYTGNGTSGLFLWGMQMEAGSFATSYIPTTAAQVTRSADSASMTGSNFSSWYRADQGTIYSEFEFADASNFKAVVEPSDSSTFRNFSLSVDSRRLNFTNRTVSSGNDATFTAGSLSVNTAVKGAGAYSSSQTFAAANGVLPVTYNNASQSIGADRVWIGSRQGSSLFLNGRIRKIAFYPQAFSAAQLQALTA